MAESTEISWTDATFNPWIGCTKVGPGCDNCYAEALMDKRWHKVQWGSGQKRARTSAANWKQPLLWEREHEAFTLSHGRRRRVFCASLADVFDNEAPAAWRAELFALIGLTPNLDWLILTKRIGNVADMLKAPGMPKVLPANARIGATIVNQPEYDRDIGKLLRLDCPNFLSLEPLLGPIDLRLGGASMPDYSAHRPLRKLDWVIVGGESGQKARPIHPDWVRSLRDQCERADVPLHFKQWGEFAPNARTFAEVGASPRKLEPVPLGGGAFYPVAAMDRVGKRAAGRLLDGVQHDGFPA